MSKRFFKLVAVHSGNELFYLDNPMAKRKKRPSKKKNPVGRPRIYKTAEELQSRIEDYFKNGVTLRKVIIGSPRKRDVALIPVPTISGLVLHCGFADRHSFYDLEKIPEFSHTIKRARTFIEKEYEEQLHNGNATGAIFALKNFGWQDKTELEHTGEIKFTQMPAIKVGGKSLEIKIG